MATMINKCACSIPGAMQRPMPRMTAPAVPAARSTFRLHHRNRLNSPGTCYRLVCMAGSGPDPKGTPQQDQPQVAASTTQTEQEAPVVEATNVIEPSDDQPEGFMPRLPDNVSTQAKLIYTALAGLFAVQGLGLAAVAWALPSLMLPPGTAAGPLGTTLLGCAAATALQASGLMLHLTGSASRGELGTWRHQRVGMAVILYCAAVLLGCLPAVTSAPLLSGVCGAVALVGGVGCGLVLQSCLPHRPWLQWSLFPGDVITTTNSLLNFLIRDITSFAGLICLVWMAVSATGAAGVLADVCNWQVFSGAPSLIPGLHPMYPYGTSAQSAAALDMVRNMAGSGLVLSTITAHCLLEVAMNIRRLPLLEYVKTTLVQSMADGERFYELVRPPASRFNALIVVGVVLAGLVQGAFLLNAPGWGVDLNRDALLMGPLHWSLMLAAGFSLVALSKMNWSAVTAAALGVFGMLGGIVSAVTENLVVKKEWMEEGAKP